MTTEAVAFSDEAQFDLIADALVESGCLVLPDAVSSELMELLLGRAVSLDEAEMMPAGVGRDTARQLNRRIRTDRISWLSPDDVAERTYLAWMERLREAMNLRLFMGLFDYEAHFAFYGPGAFYLKHADAFRGQRNRVLTTVLYLNENWQPGDGGELLIYQRDSDDVLTTVEPRAGTLVIFLSEEFPHEVLPAKRGRRSVTGWFRVNNSIAANIDPPS